MSWCGHTVARVLDGDALELLIGLLSVLAVPEVVGLGERDRRSCHPDYGDMGRGHGNYCQSSRLGRDGRKIHRDIDQLEFKRK